MKKLLLGLTIGLLLISCSSSNDSSSSSGVYKWQFKLDGVMYQWEGTLQNPGNGGGSYSLVNNKGMLTLTNISPLMSISVQFPNGSAGNFNFNSSSPTSEGFTLIKQNQNLTSDSFMSAFGGTMNVTISSLSTSTIAANPTNPGKVIGTFSGTVKSLGGQTKTITEGSFEAMRAN